MTDDKGCAECTDWGYGNCASGCFKPVTTCRPIADVWRPPGMGACYRAACSCGWVSRTPEVGYGKPLSHDEDYARHRRETADPTGPNCNPAAEESS